MSETTTYDPNQFPSEMEPSDLADYVTTETKLDWEAAGEWRTEAREAYEFVAGRQWSDADAAMLREQNRPPVTFNRTAPMIDAIAGAQVNNRQEMKLLPRSGDDGGKAETLSGVLSWVRDQCDMEDEESEAFVDAAISGMGWIETRMDYDEDPAGKIVGERRDPFEVGWDRTARKRNLADANQVWTKQKFTPEYVASKWPAFAAEASVARGEAPDQPRRTVVKPTRDQYADGEGTTADDTGIEVTHFQWCERRPVYRVLNPGTGEIQTHSTAQWDALGEKLGDERDALQHVVQSERRWWQVFVCGDEVADLAECPDPNGPTLKCITGRRDRNNKVFYGIVRAVIDPQRWANKWLAQSLHIINTSAKSGYIYEEGAIPDVRAFEKDAAKAGTNVMVAAGALSGARMREKVPPPFPQAFDRLLQFAISAIPDVTGINRELLGTVDREQAGILEAQRKQASQAVLAPLFDSLRRYYKNEGRLLMVFIQKFIPKDKVMRIIMPDGNPQDVAMAMLPDASTYDIVVDQAPTSPNQKFEVWQALQPMLPVLVKELPPQILLDLMKFSPLPESVIAGIEKKMAAMSQQPKPPDPAVMKAQAEIQATQAKTQGDMQMKAQAMQHEQQMAGMHMEQSAKEFAMNMEFKRMEAAQELQLAAMREAQQARFRQEDADRQAETERRKATVAADASVSKMKAEKDVLAEPVREIMGPVQEVLGQMAQVLAEMRRERQDDQQHSMAMMGELRRLVSAEKEVTRGPDGRVSGARIKQPVMN